VTSPGVFFEGILHDVHVQLSGSAQFQNFETGPLLARATYPPPANRTTIDQGYDPYIRSDLLIRVLLHYEETGKFPEPQSQRADQGETFYIIHPVLKHIAILSTDDAEK